MPLCEETYLFERQVSTESTVVDHWQITEALVDQKLGFRTYNRLFGRCLLSNRMRNCWRKGNLRVGDVTGKIPFSKDSERTVVDPCG
jgi:hypothetical protein